MNVAIIRYILTDVVMAAINLTITGAAGNIAYALIPRLGELLMDIDTKIHLRLLEIEPMLGALEGVKMELDDCAYPFIEKVVCTSDPVEAFTDTHWAVLIGAKPRGKGMERSDLLKANAAIFKAQGDVINTYASKDVKVLVVGNPCNTNAYILANSAPNIPKSSIYAMTMLDQHRATSMLAKKLNVSCDYIENVIVWGNHSPSMFADFYHASYEDKSIVDAIGDEKWLQSVFLDGVGKRGAEVIQARNASSAFSAANAVIDTLIMLIDADPDQGLFSLGVYSQGEYGSTKGTIVSMPCYFDEQGSLQVLKDMQHNDFAKERLALTFKELADEAKLVEDLGLL